MTSLELAKAFEISYKETFESQKKQIESAFEKVLEQIKNEISSCLCSYDDDFYLNVAISVDFICLDAVKDWLYEYFEEMDNVAVESILTGYSYVANSEITKIELKIFL